MTTYSLLTVALTKLEQLIDKLVYHVKLLKHRPRLIWHRLWIRKDEFHSSLDMDFALLLDLNKQNTKKYIQDLVRRRQIAHEREIAAWCLTNSNQKNKNHVGIVKPES